MTERTYCGYRFGSAHVVMISRTVKLRPSTVSVSPTLKTPSPSTATSPFFSSPLYLVCSESGVTGRSILSRRTRRAAARSESRYAFSDERTMPAMLNSADEVPIPISIDPNMVSISPVEPAVIIVSPKRSS